MPNHLYMRLVNPRTSVSLSFDEVAQASHVAIGAAVVALASARFYSHVHLAKYMASVLILFFAAIKEFWFDKNFEDAVTRGSDLEDFSYYAAGVAAALLILWGT